MPRPIVDARKQCNFADMVAGFLIVFIGGGLGASLRHGVNRVSLAYLGPELTYATLFVNVVGGLLTGIIAEAFLLKGSGSPEFRLFLTTGLLGGFTTFSAFTLEAALMWQRNDHAALAIYVASSVLLPIGALFAGMILARSWL